jgi:hypothetical protein
MAGSVAFASPNAQVADPSPGSVQVSGNQLESALLPGSAFGAVYGGFGEQGSGGKLQPPGTPDVVSASCPLYSVLLGDSYLPGDPDFGFGATANATSEFLGTDRSYRQAVYQFASTRAVASLYAQTYAAYARCRSFTYSGLRIRLNSESQTRVGGHQAFLVRQVVSYLSGPADLNPYATYTLFTIDGSDAFIMNTEAGPAARPVSTTPAAFILRLITRVQALGKA